MTLQPVTGPRKTFFPHSMPLRDAHLIFWVFLFLFFLRAAIPSQVLDLVEHYSSVGGSVFEKLHPGGVGLIILSLVVLYSQDYPIKPNDLRIVDAAWIYIFAIGGMCFVCILTRHTDGLSYLVDSLVVGPFVCLLLLRMSDEERIKIVEYFIYFMILNSFILFFEYATHRRMFPYWHEPFFRPTAFLGHPLTNGVILVSTMPFVWLMRWSPARKMILTFLFLFATYATQARMASLFGTVCALGCIWVHLARSVRRGKIDEGATLAIAAAGLGAIVVALIIFVTSGLAERLIALGAFQDDSAQSRIKIFTIFTYMTPSEVLFGMRRDWADYIQGTVLHLHINESPIVVYIIQFGLFGLIILLGALFYLLWVLGTNGRNIYVAYAVASFAVVSLSSNAFATKAPIVTIICALVMGARAAGRQSVYTDPLPSTKPRVQMRPRSAQQRI